MSLIFQLIFLRGVCTIPLAHGALISGGPIMSLYKEQDFQNEKIFLNKIYTAFKKAVFFLISCDNL